MVLHAKLARRGEVGRRGTGLVDPGRHLPHEMTKVEPGVSQLLDVLLQQLHVDLFHVDTNRHARPVKDYLLRQASPGRGIAFAASISCAWDGPCEYRLSPSP